MSYQLDDFTRAPLHDPGPTIYRLEDVAIVHSGDKGDTCNIGVVPYHDVLAPWLREHLTVARFEGHFGDLVRGPITRFELPGSGCLNFVLERALAGGVTRSLGIDGHGKSWSYLAATMELDLPEELATTAGLTGTSIKTTTEGEL